MNPITYTPDETTASIKRQMKLAQEGVALSATEGYRAVEIAKELLWVAELEGAREITTAADRAARNKVPASKLPTVVVGQIINGPDDEWSGRANDTRRALYSGKLAAYKAVVEYADGREVQ